MQRLFLTLALLGIPGALASQVQQGTVTVADPIALDGRIQLDGGKHFKGMTKILVPTAIIRIATRGSLTVVNQGRFFDSDSRTAKAKGRFVVAGLDKEFIQGLARQAHDDFVARLRTTGYTVLHL